ncbi:uncharacterized protein ACR2FA_004172 [Aphomia sociella]
MHQCGALSATLGPTRARPATQARSTHRSPPTRRSAAEVLRESRRESRAWPLDDGGVNARRPRPPADMPRWPER